MRVPGHILPHLGQDNVNLVGLAVIEDEADRLTSLIEDLLDATRLQAGALKLSMSEVDLEALVRLTAARFHPETERHQIQVDFPRLFPIIVGDESRLEQVIMNLVVNARDAMGERGRLCVCSRLSPSLVSPGSGHRAVAAVELTFTDSGCGIPPENLTKIFDPFFTSKEPGKGVGLGLSVGYSIIKAHGGTIDVASEVGRGTTFRIVLPVDGVPPEGGKEEHASQDPGR